MSELKCQSCGAEQTNGLSLCSTCQQTLRVSLTNVAAFRTDALRIQPGQRVKVRGAYQSTPPPETKIKFDPVTVTVGYVDAIVIGWVRNLQDDRPMVKQPPADVSTACGWLEGYLTTIATLEWGGECVREMAECERRLQNLLDRSDTGWYAGKCGNEVGREEDEDGLTVALTCPRQLYGVQSSAWVRCPECGRTWPSRDRREVMMKEAREELAPIAIIARACVGMFDKEMSAERLDSRIRKAVKAKHLKDYGVRVLEDGKPHRVYMLGEVFDWLNKPNRQTDQAC